MTIVAQRILLVLLAISMFALGATCLKARGAAADADRALTGLASVQEQLNTIETLRTKTPSWARRARPSLGQGGLAAAVNDALAAAGVPGSALASLSPAAESPVGAAGGTGTAGGRTAFRRRAVLTLAPVTLPQIGAALKAWREAHADWVIASVDLAPEPAGRNGPAPGTDLPLRAVISIETLYVDPSILSSPPGAPH